MNLRPYQVTGSDWLASRRFGYLADAMRLGKSAQAITAASKLWDDDDGMRIGVVCPASAVPVWHNQFKQWWPGRECDFMVESYEKVTRGAFDGDLFDVLILDEAHYLKNKDAQRTRKIFGPRCDGVGGLVARAGHTWPLSGTPMPGNPSELWSVLRALAPETILKDGKPMNYWSFIQRYCTVEDNGFGMVIKGGRNLDKLKAAIEPFMLRRRYEDVAADMPELQFGVLPVNGAAPNEGELVKLLRGADTDDEILSRLRGASPHLASVRRMTGLAKVKGVLDWYADWMLSGGGKVVFMAYHREVIEALCRGLGDVPVLMGGATPAERESAPRRFQEDNKCVAFVGQLQAAGTAIDLSAASCLVFVESDWVPGNNLQAAMRIQKVGKMETCQIYSATLPGSVDELVANACMRKMRDNAIVFG